MQQLTDGELFYIISNGARCRYFDRHFDRGYGRGWGWGWRRRYGW